MWNLREVKYTETGNRMVVTRVREVEEIGKCR